MAVVRWSERARREFRDAVAWLVEHRSVDVAARLVSEVDEAIRRASARPEAYAWVGSVHPVLEVLPRTVRRVLTQRRRYVVYYRYVPSTDQFDVLAVRGTAQLPPAASEVDAPAEP